MYLYNVVIVQVSYKPEYRGKPEFGIGASGTPQWHRRVRAEGYRAAVEKCLPDILKELPKLQGKYVSIYCGRYKCPSFSWSRLMPLCQIEIATGEIRGKVK